MIRYLKHSEIREFRKHLEETWADSLRYPVYSRTANANVEAFDRDAFEESIREEDLQRMLLANDIRRVFEVSEIINRAVDVPEWSIQFGCEAISTAWPFDWFIYSSHEYTLTVGGWLLDLVKDIWPEWRQHIAWDLQRSSDTEFVAEQHINRYRVWRNLEDRTHVDEESPYLARIKSGEHDAIQVYADWLLNRGDPLGTYLRQWYTTEDDDQSLGRLIRLIEDGEPSPGPLEVYDADGERIA